MKTDYEYYLIFKDGEYIAVTEEEEIETQFLIQINKDCKRSNIEPPKCIFTKYYSSWNFYHMVNRRWNWEIPSKYSLEEAIDFIFKDEIKDTPSNPPELDVLMGEPKKI